MTDFSLKNREIKVSKDFRLSEFVSPDDKSIIMDDFFWSTISSAQELRTRFGFGIRILSGHRSDTHNRAVKGKRGSLHKRIALDITPVWIEWNTIDAYNEAFLRLKECAWEMEDWTGKGFYPERKFCHLDKRALLGMSPVEWENNYVKATRWTLLPE